MKCDECRGLIEEYVDGELSRAEGMSVAAHLAACAECSDLLADLQREADIFAHYHHGREVSPELWKKVESRIADINQVQQSSPLRKFMTWIRETATAPRLSPVAGIALLVLAVGGTFILMRSGNSRQPIAGTTGDAPVAKSTSPVAAGPSILQDGREAVGASSSGPNETTARSSADKPKVVRVTPVAPAKQTPEQLVREAEERYIAAISLLMRNVNKAKSKLDPKAAERLNESLAAIDRTILETRRVVRQHPNDPVAVQYMLTAYSKKVDVLREVTSYWSVD